MAVEVKQVSMKTIKNEYCSIYSCNNALSPYQDFDYLSFCRRYSHFSASGWKNSVSILRIVTSSYRVVYAPLLIGKSNVWILGDLCKTGYLDFIYTKDMTEQDFSEVLVAVRKFYKNKTLVLNHINQQSAFGSFLCSKFMKSGEMPCVSIPLGGVKANQNPIDSYYNSLSKKVRQNYRTAKNRLLKEGKLWELIWERGNKLSPHTHESILQLYLERQKKYDERNRTGVIKIAEHIFHRWLNPMQVALRSMDNAYYALLYIDGEIAAFLAGLISNDGKTLVIPRLAIRSEYGVYSPGTLLIFETVSKVLEDTNIENFDLSHGEEPYKFAMGGVVHTNSSFILPPINIE